MNSPRQRIVFYDGECGLCTRSVRMLLRIDRRRILRFAPLQGQTARAELPAELRTTETLDTMVYLTAYDNEQRLFTHSEAVCRVLIDLGSGWKLIGLIAQKIPTSLREWGYKWIAEHRLSFFASGACRLPSAEEKERLLP